MGMAAVPTMHEQMHQRAEQDEQKGEDPEEMRAVLGEEKETKHHSQRPPNPGKHTSSCRRLAGLLNTKHGLNLVAWPRANAMAGKCASSADGWIDQAAKYVGGRGIGAVKISSDRCSCSWCHLAVAAIVAARVAVGRMQQ